MSATDTKGIGNRLLAALPAGECDRVRPFLARVGLTRAQILHHPEIPLAHVYFPETAVLSYVFNTEDGVLLEVGSVGNNGLAGVSVALGASSTPNHTEVLIGGTALRMSAHPLREEMRRCPVLSALVYRYAQATIIHAGQMQVCTRLHSLDERLAGWLLLLYDLNPPRPLPLTHQAIGQMLGVRRSGVSEAAHHLQAKGLISYTRGQIAVPVRQAVAEFACNCYRVIQIEYERVFNEHERVSTDKFRPS